MIWALLAVATLATCELFLRLPVLANVRRAAQAAGRAGRVIGKPSVSDHWKERALPRYALRIATGSLSAMGLLVVACAPILALALAGPLFGKDVAGFLVSWQGILGLTAIAMVYLWIRTRLTGNRAKSAKGGSDDADKSGYSGLDRILHRLALGSAQFGELLFDIKGAVAPNPPADASGGRHIFVAGLARAGTTILMRQLYGSGRFASLTYRDMPFVMAPNLWAKLSGRSRREMDKAERAHGDGVMVDFDSPEALEEPFWRTFCGTDYIRPDALVPHEVDAETLEKYRRFVGRVLARYGAANYLAKNNNNILRLPTLRKAFPDALVLVPFRAPLAQAGSLARQHQLFHGDEDSFTADYMKWLVHHEFGPGHRPFVFDGAYPSGTPDSIDYWLSVWISVHRHVLALAESDGEALVPIAYEDLCAPDRAAWHALCERTSIPSAEPEFSERGSPAPQPDAPSLLAEAEALYARLRALSHDRLGLEPPRASAAL